MLTTLSLLLFWVVLLIPIPAYSDRPEISSLANSHPDYLALRNATLGRSFSVNALTLTRDVGAFHLTSGTVTFLEPVLGETVVALFSGEGEFRLQPATTAEAGVIELYTQQRNVRESFKEAVFCFTDNTDLEVREAGHAGTPGRAAEILEQFRKRMRRRRENPRSFTEAIFTGADMDNIDADLLSGLLNRYAGDEVIHSAGGGNFAVGARSSWYPSIGSFRDRATYETRFTYPKRYLLAGVGERIEEGRDGKLGFSKWKSEVPLKVAGFNYGDFNKITVKDKKTGTVLEGFATNRVPDFLRQAEMSDVQPRGTIRGRTGIAGGPPRGRMSPKRLMQGVVKQSQGATQLWKRTDSGTAPTMSAPCGWVRG